MDKQHHYTLTVRWTGNKGQGTSDYRAYERSHSIFVKDKAEIQASSDPAFRGDKSKHNPEDMFLSSLSSCHMLWYLHLCADAGVNVVEYTDNPKGTMLETSNGGHFVEVILRPEVVVADRSMIEKANALHAEANKCCFIANSCNFPVGHEPVCRAQ